MQHLVTFEALLYLYKELKHSLYKFYKGNASIPYINSKVPQKCQDFGFFEKFFHLEKNPKFFLNTYVNPKFPQDSKNHT